MPPRVFDKKFGTQLLQEMSSGPGVYSFLDAEGRVLYVGKAKNLQRRLRSYRNASSKRLHRKMRLLVQKASSLQVCHTDTEEAALLKENALIQEQRPTYNVEGAYAFLYPAVGLRAQRRQTLLAFSTQPDTWRALGLDWYGVFRSRPRVREGFEALVELLSLIGHREPRAHLPVHAALRGSRLVGVRQLPPVLLEALSSFLLGADRRLLGELARALLAKPRARRAAAEVEAQLHLAERFFRHDCARLYGVRQTLDYAATYVPQSERDALFIRARMKASGAPAV